MQTPRPPRIKMHKSNARLITSNVIALTLVLVQLMVGSHPTRAWQYADNQQVFPNRHPDFYHAPPNQFALNTQNLYNQPLNSLPLQQQQFLTPTSSNVAQQPQPPATAAMLQPVVDQAEPFSALFAPNSRISSSAPAPSEQPTIAAAAAISDDSTKSINARDTSQQQAKPDVDTANSQIKSNHEHHHQESSSDRHDHDIVPSPSPLGKILDAVARETVSALSSSIAASKDTSATTTTNAKDAKQQTTSNQADARVTHATKSESGSTNEQVLLHLKPLTQAVATAAAAAAQKKKSDKNSVNSIEQQIINQHARATSYATLHSRRYEPPTPQPAAATAATVPQQLVRLLPTKHRGDTKLFSNLLSTLSGSGHNSASSGGGGGGGGDGADSSSQAGGHLASLVDNFKSGISSRSSLVKAAISDNKLARTLSTVGKTIGGNKYVASAGAAAALAALGLTVSKFLSPYVMAGSYSKLGGAGPMDPLITSGSYLQPAYMTTGGGGGYGPGTDRNFHYLPTSDSMLAATTNNNQQYLDSAQFDPNSMGQLQAAFNSYASQQQQQQQQPDQINGGMGNFYASYRPSSGATTGGGGGAQSHRASPSSQQKNGAAFDGGANGHYSGFYSSQPEYEQQNGSGGLVDMSSLASSAGGGQPQQQFGSYISGAPTSGDFSLAAGQQYGTSTGASTLPGGDLAGYVSSTDQMDLSSAGNTYEPTMSGQQQFDQIMSSASSDTPTYANSLAPQPQAPANSRVSFPKSTTSSWNSGRAPQHRSGAVLLKLDEATRNLIRQQLQAELTARAASTNYNYNYLPLNSASRGGGADQSSGDITEASNLEFAATPPVVSMTDQRVGAPDSSGDYATFVQWQPQSSSVVAQQQQGGVRSGTIKSNYNGAQQPAPQVLHLRQQGQHSVAGGSAQANRYISLGPQMQTKRNEPVASNTHVLIRPNTMRPVDSSPASSKPGQQQQQQQPSRAQPQLVPIVGSSTRSLSTATQWSSVGASKQATDQKTGGGGDKKLPAAAVGSLDLLRASGGESANDDSKTSNLLTRAARNPQASRMATAEAERANNSWLVPALDQQSLIRDYEVLAAAQQQQQQQQRPPVVDGDVVASTRPPQLASGHSTTTTSQQDDELLQVASSMRANLIQSSSEGDRPQLAGVADGAEYQLDTLDGGGDESEQNNNSTFDDKTARQQVGADGNKLIEAKTNTNNAAIVVADGGKRASGQHDKRHRSHSLSTSSQHRAATTDEGDNAPASVLSATEQRQEQATPSPPATTTTTTTTATTVVDRQQQTLSSRLSQVVGGSDNDDDDQTKYQQHRAFRGIVAGGLGGSGH